ncbi:hypothetical protein [Legionella sp. km772]|uniref:hypothetical protein n=1 Tax=Legionella sp. km772 TaxID=2498111 RepID=UPI0013155629|nr:hypothetical protein [Legionella sp. km772]
MKDFNKLLKNKSLHAEEQQTATKTLTHTTHKYKDRMDSLKAEVEVASQRLTN